MLRLPDLLLQLIKEGRWPVAGVGQNQNLSPLVGTKRIQELAPEETTIYLYSPPFLTVRESSLGGERNFWSHPMSAPSEIDFDRCLVIGDFGLGSDAPLLLDYRENLEDPRVIRLRWGVDGRKDNHWVVAAPDFATCVRVLGL